MLTLAVPWQNLAFHADERFVSSDSLVDVVVDDSNKTVWNDLYPSNSSLRNLLFCGLADSFLKVLG